MEPARASRRFGIASLVLGILALVGRLGFEAAKADLGADLGIDGPASRFPLHGGSLAIALAGAASAFGAALTAQAWRARLSLPVPGILVNGMALLWSLLWV